jgi:SAM-dependent methyltransferase
MTHSNESIKPDRLLLENRHLFEKRTLPGPVLDLACGDGHNGLFLAALGHTVTLADRSSKALDRAKSTSERWGIPVHRWQVDFESGDVDPLPKDHYGAVLVFRYLHRPLFSPIRESVKSGGLLLYETFTTGQSRFGKPRNPDFLLEPGELRGCFGDWYVLYTFEGIRQNPTRSVAQIVCLKP